MEKLCVLIDEYIPDIKKAEEFQLYCRMYCGWLPESLVDEESFLTCLESFNAR